MRKKSERGSSVLEFAIIAMSLILMMLGVGVFGVNMIRVQQTEQVAMEAGQLFAAGLDLSQPGNQTILTTIASDLGLSSTAGQGNAVVILSALTYVDQAACAAAGEITSSGNPSSGCVNYGQWVFSMRLTIGNTSVRPGNIGSPLTSGPTGVTINSDGTIPLSEYTTQAGDVANFSAISPYSDVGGVVSGLPSGKFIYIAEVAANSFQMFPWSNAGATYAYGVF